MRGSQIPRGTRKKPPARWPITLTECRGEISPAATLPQRLLLQPQPQHNLRTPRLLLRSLRLVALAVRIRAEPAQSESMSPLGSSKARPEARMLPWRAYRRLCRTLPERQTGEGVGPRVRLGFGTLLFCGLRS